MKCDSNPMDIYTHTAPPRQVATVFNDWTENAFNIQAVSVRIKSAASIISLLLTNDYTMDVNLYKVEIMQHSKESACCVQNLIHKVNWIFEKSFMCNMLAVV